MMGRRGQGQGQIFYEFRLDEAVPEELNAFHFRHRATMR